MIVEFLGPPGAGKSTLIQKLVAHEVPSRKRFQAVNLHALAHDLPKSRTLTNLLRTIFYNPKFAAHLAQWMTYEQNTSLAYHTALKLARLERVVVQLRRQSRIFLVDEGLTQRAIWTFAYFGSSPARFDALIRTLPNPNIFVVISEEPTVSLKRILQRSDTNPSIRALDPDSRIRVLSRYESLARSLITEAKVPVVSVRGGAPEVAHEIDELLTRHQ